MEKKIFIRTGKIKIYFGAELYCLENRGKGLFELSSFSPICHRGTLREYAYQNNIDFCYLVDEEIASSLNPLLFETLENGIIRPALPGEYKSNYFAKK